MPTRSNLHPLTLALLGALVTWTGAAQATPEFPAVVATALGLPSLPIDPPQGCTLCHTTDAGGTALRKFGALVQQYGAQPYQDDTLKGALAAVEEKDPELIADIKAGRDPNDDPGASSLPTPEYGCAAAPLGERLFAGWPAGIVGAIVTIGASRRRSRRRLRSERRGSPPRRR